MNKVFSLNTPLRINIPLNVVEEYAIKFIIVFFVIFWVASQIVLIYLPAKVVSVGLSREQGALIMSIFAAVAAFSQILVGIFADLLHIPISYLLTFSLVVMSVTSATVAFCHSFSSFIICASLFAICKGEY